MTAFKKLLLPTNFSDLAMHAAKFARTLVEEFGGTLYVLHVSQPAMAATATPDVGLGMLVLPPDEIDELRRSLDAFVRSALGGIHAPTIKEVRTGPPAPVICEYAHEMGVDLIVLGTHARGLASRLFLGSVSKAVLEHASCAVLMVPWMAEVPHESGWAAGELVAAGRQQGAF